MPTLENILGDELNIAVLRWLTSVRGAYSGHEVARRLNRHQSSVRKALERLVETRVVTRQDIGNSAAYALNEELIVVQMIILPLFEQERRTRTRLLQELAHAVQIPVVQTAILYGSAARGRRDFRDIDVLAVAQGRSTKEAVRDKLITRTDPLSHTFGVPVSLIVLERDELATTGYTALLDEIRRDGIALTPGRLPTQLAGIQRWDVGIAQPAGQQ